MYSFLARRVLATVPVLLIVAVLVFLLLRLTPGDPAAIMAGDAANTEQIAQIRTSLGLDRPILAQFGIWFGNLLAGDLGEFRFKGFGNPGVKRASRLAQQRAVGGVLH